ncbi:hypothetical protein HP15_2528 [Marinobacter adhaerens HP15]|uniref:Uncharacterized protein n=1 Tax=Marinobacter adhaerens (strain DSM 23420 / HP15) TaxID=225937 RepID=E4PIP2_MARAH|nr:hypothetical protein HP15_2528 [Marinobacter adhaerens HP15]
MLSFKLNSFERLEREVSPGQRFQLLNVLTACQMNMAGGRKATVRRLRDLAS